MRGGNGAVTPNERINVGLIGRGAMGSGHLQILAGHKETQLVAVCDVDRSHRLAAKKTVDEKQGNADCRDYNDFRELLARTMRPGDQVVFLSNGGFGDLPRNTLAYLQESGGA